MPGSDTDAPPDAPTFIPLVDYAPPARPTEETLRRVLRRTRERLLGAEEADPLIAEDRLDRLPLERLDRIVGPPAFGPVLDEMSATFAGWLGGANGAQIQVVAMPPCDGEGVVAAWAARHGLATLPPPPRAQLRGHDGEPDLGGAGVLVIPRLEEWALRHRQGLGAVRGLLRALANDERRCLVGCGTYAWGWLARAAGVATQLPRPTIFRPFDAPRLRRWFAGMLEESGTAERVRLSTTGEDVLALDEDGEPESDYLRILAAHSRGVPWVAWHLWRAGLRDTPDRVEEGADPLPERDDDRTLWVAELPGYALPPGAETEAGHVLHALLIHGPLAPEMLAEALSLVGATPVLPALIDAGMVRRGADGLLACVPEAYPTIREALANAGHPLGAV